MKKKVAFILIAVMLLIPITALADGNREVEEEYNKKILLSSQYPVAEVYVNGEYIDIGQIRNERTMVKIRRLAEALGFEVDYKHEGRYIYINGEDKEIELQIDNKIAKINGEEVTLDVAPFIEDDITIVPLRFISEGLGAKVTWNQEYFIAFVNEFEEEFSGESSGTIYSAYLNASFHVPKGFFDLAHIVVIPEGDYEGFYLVHNASAEAVGKDYPEGFGGVMWKAIKVEEPEHFPSYPTYLVDTFDEDFILISPESDMGFTEETVDEFNEVSKLGEQLLRSIHFGKVNLPVETIDKLFYDFGPKDIFVTENFVNYYNDERNLIYYSNYLLDDKFATLDAKAEIVLDEDNNLISYSFKVYDVGENDYSRGELSIDGGKVLVEKFQKEVLGRDPKGTILAPDGYASRYEPGVHEIYKDTDGGVYVVDLPNGIIEYYNGNEE